MKENNLLVTPNLRLKAKRDNQPNKNKLRVTRPNQFWGIDITKVTIPSFGWLCIVVVLDRYAKKIVWFDALNMAYNNEFPYGIVSKKQDLHLISDNGSQPTSQKFMAACLLLGIRQIFTSYNNPKGATDTKRVTKTIKEDFTWIREFSSPFELIEDFQNWVVNYNTDHPHSSLNYLTPFLFEKEHLLTTNILP